MHTRVCGKPSSLTHMAGGFSFPLMDDYWASRSAMSVYATDYGTFDRE